jgi:hypothetical protein
MRRWFVVVALSLTVFIASTPSWSVHQEPTVQELAAQGDARGQFRLAMEYMTGKESVEKDAAKSWYWFHKALKSGLPGDLEPMAHQSLRELEATAPPAEIEKGKKMLEEDEKKAK